MTITLPDIEEITEERVVRLATRPITFAQFLAAFETLPSLTLQAEWVLHEPRPDVFDTLTALLSA